MNGLSEFETAVSTANLILSAILIGRLMGCGLHRRYPFFTALITANIAEDLVPVFIRNGSWAYVWAFMSCEALLLFFYVLTVLELSSNVLQDLKGFAAMAKRYIKWAMGFSVVISLSLLIFEHRANTFLNGFFIFERAVMCSLLLFVGLLVVLLVHYPVPLNRNVIMYFIGYAIFFLSQTAALFVHDLGLSWDRQLGDSLVLVSCFCLVFWTVALSRQGEQKKMASGFPRDAADAERLLAQMQAINNSLQRIAKK
ncbi:MAG: hypothetical protein ACRD4P_03960 [Bryobacteraceae bacterium]